MEKNKILVVEDEKDTRYILEKLLTKNNYEVKTVTNGQEALDILSSYDPKIILADWTMPILDGIELCNILKKDEKHKLIYFIMLTARASLKDRVTGLDIGADDFLVKPVENQELLARIRTGVRIFNLQNELKANEQNKAVIAMACTIGHKLNNPLSSIVLVLKNIEEVLTSQVDAQFADDLEILNKSIDRIKTLANDLVHLQDPTLINYTNDKKMLKLD